MQNWLLLILILILILLSKLKQIVEIRNLIFDGTFSQRRNAEWATVPFMSQNYNTVIHVEVGGQRANGLRANQLEFSLTKKGFEHLASLKDNIQKDNIQNSRIITTFFSQFSFNR